jgi:hypothetical protein
MPPDIAYHLSGVDLGAAQGFVLTYGFFASNSQASPFSSQRSQIFGSEPSITTHLILRPMQVLQDFFRPRTVRLVTAVHSLIGLVVGDGNVDDVVHCLSWLKVGDGDDGRSVRGS